MLLLLQGRSMEAQILKAWIPTFKQQLKEDSVYYIKYFQVLNARASFRPADHPYMIRFTAHTKVTEVTPVPDTFPLYACTPISFSALHQKARNPDYTYTSGTMISSQFPISLVCVLPAPVDYLNCFVLYTRRARHSEVVLTHKDAANSKGCQTTEKCVYN